VSGAVGEFDGDWTVSSLKIALIILMFLSPPINIALRRNDFCLAICTVCYQSCEHDILQIINRFRCKLKRVLHGARTWNDQRQEVKGQGHRRPKLDLKAWKEASFNVPVRWSSFCSSWMKTKVYCKYLNKYILVLFGSM